MNLSVYNNIPEYNQNLSSYEQRKSTWGNSMPQMHWLLKHAPISLIENVP